MVLFKRISNRVFRRVSSAYLQDRVVVWSPVFRLRAGELNREFHLWAVVWNRVFHRVSSAY